MKTKIVLASVFAALSGLAGLATTASAGTDFKVRLNIGVPALPPPPVVVIENNRGGHDHDRDEHREAHGYWKEVPIKVWVPSHWVVSRDYCGREVRSFEHGHYVYRNDRVWVDTGYGRHEGSRGYLVR
jgi:hypothetical protein